MATTDTSTPAYIPPTTVPPTVSTVPAFNPPANLNLSTIPGSFNLGGSSTSSGNSSSALAQPNAAAGSPWYGVKASDVTPSLTSFLNGMSNSSPSSSSIQSSSGISSSTSLGAALGTASASVSNPGGAPSAPQAGDPTTGQPAGAVGFQYQYVNGQYQKQWVDGNGQPISTGTGPYSAFAATQVPIVTAATQTAEAGLTGVYNAQLAATSAQYGNMFQQLQLQQTGAIGQFSSAAASMNPYSNDSPVVAAGVAAINQKYALFAQSLQAQMTGAENVAGANLESNIASMNADLTKNISSIMTSAFQNDIALTKWNMSYASGQLAQMRTDITTGAGIGLSNDQLDQLATDNASGNLTQDDINMVMNSEIGQRAIAANAMMPGSMSPIDLINNLTSSYAVRKQQLGMDTQYQNYLKTQNTVTAQGQETTAASNLTTYMASNPAPQDIGSTNLASDLSWAAGAATQTQGFGATKTLSGQPTLNPNDPNVKILNAGQATFSQLTNLDTMLSSGTVTPQTSSFMTTLSGMLADIGNKFANNGITVDSQGNLQGVQYSGEAGATAMFLARGLVSGRITNQEISNLQGAIGTNLSNPTALRKAFVQNMGTMMAESYEGALTGAINSHQDVSAYAGQANALSTWLTQNGIGGASGTGTSSSASGTSASGSGWGSLGD